MTRPANPTGARRTLVPIVVASLVTTLGALPVFLLAAQSVLVSRDLHFDELQLGVTVACFFGSATLAALACGRVADRLGSRRGLMAAGTIAAIGGSGAATATSWGTLTLFMSVLGVAHAACQITSNLATARRVPPPRRGLAFGAKQAAIPAAMFLAGLAVPTVTTWAGWRATFVGTALAGLVTVLAGAPRRRDPDEAPRSGSELDRPPLGGVVLAAFAVGVASAAANAMGAFVASWAFQIGLSPAVTGSLISVGSALNVAARLLGGHLADRRRGRHLRVVAAQMLVGGAAVAVLSLPTTATFTPALLVAFAVGWSWPGLLMFAVVRVGRDAPAATSGVVQSGAFAGGTVGPLAFGVLVNSFGYTVAWYFTAGALLLGATLVLLARRTFLSDLQARPPRRPLDGEIQMKSPGGPS